MATTTISFKIKNGIVYLVYEPKEVDVHSLHEKINRDRQLSIKRIFHFEFSDLARNLYVNDEIQIAFKFADKENGLYHIDGRIFGLVHDIKITTDLDLEARHFISYRGISIFRKLNKVLQQPIKIISDLEAQQLTDNGLDIEDVLPLSDFKRLINGFPNSTELDKYANKRIGQICEDYFDKASVAVLQYEQYFEKRKNEPKITVNHAPKILWEFESQKYELLHAKLIELLDKDALSETEWQARILDFILLLFPKYIAVLDEICFKDESLVEDTSGGFRSDLILLDVDGHIDVIELKTPYKAVLRKSKYRNKHYPPSGELSSTIMQLEKYLFVLSSNVVKQQKKIEESTKFKALGMTGFSVKIVNPKGLVIIGRDNQFDDEQKKDFEVIRRKYSNVLDILTYDDLLRRLQNLIRMTKLNKGGDLPPINWSIQN
jgi:hypothetical protein